MTFLDTSVIIDMLAGVSDVVDAVEQHGQPYLTSALCVYEVIDGTVGTGETDVMRVRQEFGGVRSVELTEQIAFEANRMQDHLMADGDRMATRDLLIAATARSTGDKLLVADRDFETDYLTELMPVTNLRTKG